MPLIIYPNDDQSLAFIYPASDMAINNIALKDVPAGKPYLIVPDELIPTNHTFFEAFQADFSNPDGYGIGHDSWFANIQSQEIQPEYPYDISSPPIDFIHKNLGINNDNN